MAFRSAGSVREYLGVPDDERQAIVDLVSGGVRQSRDRPKPLSTRLRLEQSRVLQENRGLLADRLEKRDLPHRQAARLRPPDEVQDAGDLGAAEQGNERAGAMGESREKAVGEPRVVRRVVAPHDLALLEQGVAEARVHDEQTLLPQSLTQLLP